MSRAAHCVLVTPIDPLMRRVVIHARGRLDESECRFWGGLRGALRDLGLELLLIAHHYPQVELDVPVLRVYNMLDSVPAIAPGGGWGSGRPEATGEYDDDKELLSRERLWRGEEQDEAQRRRRAGLAFYRSFYSAALRQAGPSLALVWNGMHAQEMVFTRLCRSVGCPVLHIERGPFPGTIQIDGDGILADTGIAGSATWTWEASSEQDRWLGVFDQLRASLLRTQQTWWQQPEGGDLDSFCRRHGINESTTVLLFAGQVNRDAQSLFFSPWFESNLEAFAWFLRALPRDRDDLFVLGKHHPRSDVPAGAYQEVLERIGAGASWRGRWTEDLSIEQTLSIASRVAAVNSTVLFEALLRDRPVLMLGRGLISEKGIAFEVVGREGGAAIVNDWLGGEGMERRRSRFRDFGAYLLADELFGFTSTLPCLRGPIECAALLAGRAATGAEPDWRRLPTGRLPLDDEVALLIENWQKTGGGAAPCAFGESEKVSGTNTRGTNTHNPASDVLSIGS